MPRTAAECISGGRIEIIPGAGHLTKLEAPEAFDDAWKVSWPSARRCPEGGLPAL